MKRETRDRLIIAIIILSILGLILLLYFFVEVLKTLSTAWVSIIFCLILVASFIIDLVGKRKNKEKNVGFLKAGELIFSNHKDEFNAFFKWYLNDQKGFVAHKPTIVTKYSNLDFGDLKPIEVLYIFGDSKSLVQVIDWKGEENEKEIITFLDMALGNKHSWENALKWYERSSNNALVASLFKAIDKDLQKLKQRLIFFELGWDAYAFANISSSDFTEVTRKFPESFYGVSKLC